MTRAPTLAHLGPAGSGKGTTARFLARANGYSVFETGAALCRTPELKERLAQGNMAPTRVVMDILEDALKREAAHGRVLDGILRNLEQAEAVVRRVADGRLSVDCILVLDAPDEVLVPRPLGRSTCVACGALYHSEHHPPPREAACCCGGALGRRADDTPAGIARRHRLYHERTEPAIAALTQADLPVPWIDATGPVTDVQAFVRKALEPRRSDA